MGYCRKTLSTERSSESEGGVTDDDDKTCVGHFLFGLPRCMYRYAAAYAIALAELTNATSIPNSLLEMR